MSNINSPTNQKQQSNVSSLTHADLSDFIGSETFYKHPNSRLIYTEGVKYLADKAGAYWLIDVIASYQDELVKDERTGRFQLWIITVPDAPGNHADFKYPFIRPIQNHQAVVSCWIDSPVNDSDDGWRRNRNFILAQDILYTDFPLRELCLYVCANYNNGRIMPTLMLRSEY